MAHFTHKYEWWQALELAIENDGWKIVLLLRLTPLVPFNLLNYALGCTAVSAAANSVLIPVFLQPYQHCMWSTCQQHGV